MNTFNRFALGLLALLAVDMASAQAMAPIVNASTVFRDTVVALALILMTGAWGIGGYKIAFAGANFRDVSNLFVGGAVAGGAAAIAALFV